MTNKYNVNNQTQIPSETLQAMYKFFYDCGAMQKAIEEYKDKKEED